MEDLNYYTVYCKDGLHRGSYQDKHWAVFAARQYNGRIVVSCHPIPRPF